MKNYHFRYIWTKFGVKMQAAKFHTLAITIYRCHDLDLTVTIAKMVQNILETRKN